MTVKVDWDEVLAGGLVDDRLCPGGCGHMHRQCCDSVVLGDHQSACPWVIEWMRSHGMLDLEPVAEGESASSRS